MSQPSTNEGLALAIDLGGTKVEAALVHADGTIHAASRVRARTGADSSWDDLDHAIEVVVTASLAHLGEHELRGVGIGSAGPLDHAAGTTNPINMQNAAGYPLRERTRLTVVSALAALPETDRQQQTEPPVFFELDGLCIALAERWLGSTQGARNAFVFVVSTGIGGGLTLDGRMIRGESGNAGHLGHMPIAGLTRDAEPDDFGRTVESSASGPHTVRWAQSHGWEGASGEDLARDYRAGVDIARRAVARSTNALGAAIAGASALVDLDVVAIGGGFSFVADDYVQQVAEALARHAGIAHASRTRVIAASLGGDAPLLGAAALVHRADLLH
ncbi:ROK family protein [Humidisolicoccus flavus]|uniref:ROK family protein n=1 Tax=Humidisolicoccus flavus TaxID=3111414 RepID=UPI0032434F25